MNVFRAALYKELLLQWRTRARVLSVVVFGATALLLMSFAIGPDAGALRMHAGGFLWLALLLSSTLTLEASLEAETEQQALEGLLLLPVPPTILFYAKALANTLQLALLGAVLVPVAIVLYGAETARPLALFGLLVLGAAGLAAPGTLYATMTARARAKQTLLPLLLFPLVVPVLIAATKASSLLILGDPMRQLAAWLTLLAAFCGIYWTLCGLMFGLIVED
ncbi:MAG: heme exporter protein CcmB [Vicinamibacteria bacterium]|nr:heme exporter protein CcmB [Vicinamibacteria bacterium]